MENTEPQSSQKPDGELDVRFADIEKMYAKAQALLASINDQATTAATAYSSAQNLLAEVTAASTAALAAKTQVLDAQAVIATKSDHIEGARGHADQVRAELDRTLTAATQQATESEGLKTRTQTASDAVATLQTAIQLLIFTQS